MGSAMPEARIPDPAARGQEFLDRRLEMLREDFARRIKPYLDPLSQPALRSPQDFVDGLKASFANPDLEGATLPWGKTHHNFRFRGGEVTLWPGINGHGKSLLAGQAALDLVHQGERVVMASLEMSPVRTLARMARQASGGRSPSDRFIEDFVGWLARERRFLIFDHRGKITPKEMGAVLRFAAAEERCTQAFVDNLGLVVPGEENYDAQKDFVVDAAATALGSKMHVHILHHVRKLRDETDVPSKFDAKGAGGITDFVDNVLTVWRNKRKEREREEGKADESVPDALLICDKQRNGEWEGRIGLWYDAEGMSFRAAPERGWKRGYDISSQREPGEDDER